MCVIMTTIVFKYSSVFSILLDSTLNLVVLHSYCGPSVQKQTLLFAVSHQLRINPLPGSVFGGELRQSFQFCPCTKAAMAQSVNRFIFNEVMLRHFTPEHVQISSPKACTKLSTDEEAVVR